MSNLALVKSEMFGQNICDFYQNDQNQIVMTSEQLGTALEYAEPRKSISNLVNRNLYLKNTEFSGDIKMVTPSGIQETRVFTEDGIYEVTMLAKTEKAKEFRAWVRKILKALRTGEAKLIKPTTYQLNLSELKRQELEIKAKNADARLKNATVRQASFLLKEVDRHKNVLSIQSVELITINAFEMITGGHALPRTQVEKTYTATEIGKELGVSSNRIGKLANRNNLKTDEYGITVLDKSPYSSKQMPAFRYNERGRERLRELAKESC